MGLGATQKKQKPILLIFQKAFTDFEEFPKVVMEDIIKMVIIPTMVGEEVPVTIMKPIFG